MQLEAEALIAARKKATVIHHAKNIVAAGDVVETTVRDVISKRLPRKFRVGQGHVVNPMLKTSPQFDLIIANNENFPVLFQDDNGTEWFPFEGVYAIGEVKSSYDHSKEPIQAFSEKIRRTKAEFSWPKRTATVRAIEKGGKQVANTVQFDQLFSFMVFIDSSDFNPETIESFYKDTAAEYLPNLVYFADKGVLLNMKLGGVDGSYPMEMNLYPEISDHTGLVQYKSKWCLRIFKEDDEQLGLGMAFFTFYYLLMSHLEGCEPRPSSLLPYYILSAVDLGPRMHSFVFE